ncbi:MAG: formylmethanofuran dehydrogenase subunit B, partial [Planctomycetaceae bacterium]
MTDSPPDSRLTSIACTRCGCVCDDLQLEFRGGRVSSIQPACVLADEWFRRATVPDDGVAAEIDGSPVDFDLAAVRAAALLSAAKLPLFFGLSRSSTDGQRAVCELADRLGGIIDTTAS